MSRRIAVHLLAAWLLCMAAGCASKQAASPLQAELVQTALDREALFTIAGGLKPVSTGFWQGSINLDDPSVAELMQVREALSPLRTDDLYADVQSFDLTHDGQRIIEAYVAHRPAVAATIERTQAFWARYAIAPDTHPAELLAVVDRMPKLDRFRAYGLLFGYPDEAIEFFVNAAAEEEATGEFVKRTFVQIPTFDSPTGRFVYAVAVEHEPTAADRRLRAIAAEILDRYRSVRNSRRPLDTLKAVVR